MIQMSGWWDSDLSPHLELATPSGEVFDLIVDSGFNGELMLPVAIIQKLGLQQRGTIQNTLADGSTLKTETFMGNTLVWRGDACCDSGYGLSRRFTGNRAISGLYRRT
jgi:hypothetical protein